MTEREWKWELCLGCGPFIRCPTCNGNCGFAGSLPDGSDCPTCPEVYEAWMKARKEGTIPDRPEFKREAILKARGRAHQRALAAGLKVATLDDLLNIGLEKPKEDA